MIKTSFLILIVFASVILTPTVFGQEFTKATWQETASVIFDQRSSNSIISSVGFETTNNDEIRIPDELLEKISSYEHLKSVLFTNTGQCIIGVTDIEQCVMINFDYFGLKGDEGIKNIQTTGKQIGDELITDINQILDLDTQYHSVFVHVADDANMEFGTSGVISGRGTVSVVYVEPKQETDFLFVNLAGKLIPRDIRTGEGFYSVAKTLALKSDSIISLAILPDPEKTLFMLKVSYEQKDAIDDISLINPLEYLNVKELKRSSYFKDSFTPLNSVLQVIILPDTTSKIDAVKIHAITDLTSLDNISQKGWFFSSPAGDKIDARFLFGTEQIVTEDELIIEIGPWERQKEMEFLSVENIPEELIPTEEHVSTEDIGSLTQNINQQNQNEQYVILVIIIVAAIGAAIFYLKGYKRNAKEVKQQQQKQ